jgi:hypothetical protein
VGAGEEDFFLKKEAKTFATLSRSFRRVRDSGAKVFWFFSSEKNNLSYFGFPNTGGGT